MSWLALQVLRLFHIIYSLVITVSSFRSRHLKPAPASLTASRSKLPKHLALVIACDNERIESASLKDAFLECVERATVWCRAAGISRLTVYDRQGVLMDFSAAVRARLCYFSPDIYDDEKPEKDIAYPLTPPLSEDSDSQSSTVDYPLDENLHVITMYPMDPDAEMRRSVGRVLNRRRIQRKHSVSQEKPFILHIVTRDSGKPAIASAANHYLRMASVKMSDMDDNEPFQLTVKELQSVLEGEQGLPPLDLTIVHHVTPPKCERPPLELQGFPPWQSRLTEFYHNGYTGLWSHWSWLVLDVFRSSCIILSEVEFRSALDEYANAEFRLGK